MKKDFLISLITLVLVIIIDLALKIYYSENYPVSLNTGFMLGLLHGLPKTLTVVSLCSFGGVLFFIYLILSYLLSSQLQFFKISLSLLVGGILSNVIDRSMHGGTIDFIPFFNFSVFNPADVFQWIGALGVAYTILFNDHALWFPDNQRSLKLVNPAEQLKFAFKFSMISFGTIIALGIFTISYITLVFENQLDQYRSFIFGYALSFLSLSVFFCILVFFAGLILSQRIVGPLYAFEKYVEDLLSGEKRTLRLREGDNFKHLEDVAKKLYDRF